MWKQEACVRTQDSETSSDMTGAFAPRVLLKISVLKETV